MRARDIKGTKSNKIVTRHGKVLPKRIFAKWLLDSPDAPWIDANENMVDLAEKGEMVFVGEYRLVKTHRVNLKLKIA